jgi:hypothetical protein
MEPTKIRVFPTVDLLGGDAIEKAARDALFGPKTRLMHGGWSFHDRELVSRLPIAPIVVANAGKATEVGLAFMKEANARWARTQKNSALFPIDKGLFRLLRAEVIQIGKGRKPLAWRVGWIVLAHVGDGAALPRGLKSRYVPVAGACISLVVSLTGRVVGGSATWRPTLAPVLAPQLVTADVLETEFAAARKSASAETGAHDHGGPKSAAPPAPLPPELRYTAGGRAQLCAFLDPRLQMADDSEGHHPATVIPMTDYGVSLSILTLAAKAADGRGEVTLIPWALTGAGAISLNPPPDGFRAHWTVVDPATDASQKPQRFSNGAPLVMKGLARVALTVVNPKGAISHCHAEVCSAVDAARPELLV